MHAWKRAPPPTDQDKILQGGRHPDIITCENFGDDRLMSLGLVMGQILFFSLDIRSVVLYAILVDVKLVLNSKSGTFIATR